jgi:branched-chain amino acid transport system substrate-binding protein
MPLQGSEAAEGRDVVDGARLALADAHAKVGGLAVRVVYLSDTAGHGAHARWSPAVAAANARRATEDSTAIAFIGDFDSGATRSSLPITNQARMLQVSPASAAVDLVQPFLGAGDQLPDLQHTGERTFGRVIPSDEVQGEAGAVSAKRLGFARATVQNCSSAYARVLSASFKSEARSLGLQPTRVSGPNTVEYLPSEASSSCQTLRRTAASVMATDALFGGGRQLQAAYPRSRLYITSAAEDPKQLPAAGQEFLRAFRARYRRAPGHYAAYGYEAMAVVLDSIRRAGSNGDDRDAVVHAFFDTTDRRSVLGTYSIDDIGNTTLNRLAGYRIVNGRPRFAAALRVNP